MDIHHRWCTPKYDAPELCLAGFPFSFFGVVFWKTIFFQPVVNEWFGARWFWFWFRIPLWKGLLLRGTLSRTLNHQPKPSPKPTEKARENGPFQFYDLEGNLSIYCLNNFFLRISEPSRVVVIQNSVWSCEMSCGFGGIKCQYSKHYNFLGVVP